MYEQFAMIYDEMMEEIPYDEWFAMLQHILREKGIRTGHICELGCGTGEMVRRFAEAGYEVTGIDLSPDMLAKASEKTQGMENILYFEQNMTDFSLHKPADVVLCICDSMNYLLSKEELRSMFCCIKEALTENGVAVLDMKTAYCFQKVMGNQTRVDETEDALMIWDNTYDEAAHINEYLLTIFTEDKATGMYERYDECHQQRAYTEEEVKECLNEASLRLVKSWTEEQVRTYFVVQNAE